MVYLPGDIHDTRCVTGPALLFRFTERDLKREDKEERRVTQICRAGWRLDRGVTVIRPIVRWACSTPERTVAIGSVLAAMVLVVLDAAIVNVALPTIAQSLQVTPAMSVWIITAYQTALVMALLPCAALGESFGYRRVFTAGVALFTGASILCALAPSLPWLVAARFAQGLGGAAVMALGVALLRFVVPRQRLGAAIGWNALAVALSSAAGPTIGAAILSGTSWPWLFAVNLPLGLLVLLASRALPAVDGTARRLDLSSVALNAGAFAAFVIGAELLPGQDGAGGRPDCGRSRCAGRTRSARKAEGRAADSARPAAHRFIPDFSDCLGPVLLRRRRGHGGSALLPAARPRAERLDDRPVHDAMAADRRDRGPVRRPPVEPRVDGLALRRGWSDSRDRARCRRAVAAAGSPAAARC